MAQLAEDWDPTDKTMAFRMDEQSNRVQGSDDYFLESATGVNSSISIPKGKTICYYCGHIHNFHSLQTLEDTSYSMLVSGDVFVDTGPLPHVKARFINDPLNEDYVNCMFVPEPKFHQCAVVAVRDIQRSQELFASYAETYWSNRNYTCSTYTRVT
jgi:hypothetical protein